MARTTGSGNWMAKAFANRGRLHRALGIPLDEPIPVRKLRAILKDKKASTSLKRAAVLALRVKVGDLKRGK